MVVWADIPSDLLNSISNRFDIVSRLRLSTVCTSWASAIRCDLPALPSFHPDQPVPWLFLRVEPSTSNPDHSDFSFYDLNTTTLDCIPSPIPYPLVYGARWLGSNNGWLAFISQQHQLHLISPLTGAHLLLPLIKLPDGFQGVLAYYWGNDSKVAWNTCMKVILCQEPDHSSVSHSGLLVLALFWPHGLAVWKECGDKWTWLNLKTHYNDAIVYDGKIYAVGHEVLHWWEVTGSSFRAWNILPISTTMPKLHANYLVQVGGKLLMICRNREWGGCGHRMSVYELNFYPNGIFWRHVESIGNHTMFLGKGYSSIASTIGLDGAQGNCIYYVDDDYFYCKIDVQPRSSFNDSGVQNLKKNTYEKISLDNSPPATWFWPCAVK
ncbi:hypothetical protein LUZ63_007664 [Rhynchospora breviuscula]|uniref:F-box domain-containing protein n=1 Tax=Rhynchospora breviuscula TaxID=2022672 RepID=A0A9Q0CS43_9POAL|nr:hypothetical protein LUZ63_007664 [Rhynchospora breviuscula]